MTFIYSHSEKKVVQKEMEKPHPSDYSDHKGNYLADMEDYTQHLASLQSYPAEKFTPDQDGKEVEVELIWQLYTGWGWRYVKDSELNGNKINLNKLRRVAMPYADFRCDKCGKGFNSLDGLGWHVTANCDDTKFDPPIALPINGQDETELDKELSMMTSWIDQIGRDNTNATRGAAKITIGMGMKRLFDAATLPTDQPRLFTINEARDIWEAAFKYGLMQPHKTSDVPGEEQYFQTKFGITL